MKFAIASVLAALAATATALPAFTNSAFDLVPGSTFTLTWGNATGPVTIYLATGESDDLKKVQAIDSNVEGGSFTWTVPTGLVSGTYAFEITDSTGTNYSKQFKLTGTGSASASPSTAVSTVVSSTAASSTAVSSAATSSTTITSLSMSSSSPASSSSSTSKTKTLKTTALSNSTTTKTTATGTKTSTSATATPVNTNNGPQAKSPLAFVLVAFAALLYFN